MRTNLKIIYSLTSVFILMSCGGGGGGSSEPAGPAPLVELSSSTSSTEVGTNVNLTWTSTNTTSCSAAWTSSTASSGTQEVMISKAGANNFTLSCSGTGGSKSASTNVDGFYMVDGISVDGYVSGATIFVDANSNFVMDGDEDSTTSGNSGEFNIKLGNSALISLGGQDVDTQTQLDNFLMIRNLSGYTTDKYMVTPVTSVAFFKPEMNIYSALGLDSSVDILKSDPVANIGDGGSYDLLYEKGNQLTIIAFSLQNMSNSLKSSADSTADYFKALSEEIDSEFSSTSNLVNIEKDEFIEKVIDNIINEKSLTISNTNKANVITALASVLPVVGVKSTGDLTNAVVNFSTNQFQTDLISIANGSADDSLINSYSSDVLNYISSDQNINSDDIRPTIITFDDDVSLAEDGTISFSPLKNDSFTPGEVYSLSITNPSNGVASIADNKITYTPNANFNGVDNLSYTVTQGTSSSTSNVSFTISSVNDLPVITVSATISISENSTSTITVTTSDVDGDTLALTLSGTDADDFTLTDNVISFNSSPDYETKKSYSFTLNLSDGTETVTKDVTINITNVAESQGYKVPEAIEVIETQE